MKNLNKLRVPYKDSRFKVHCLLILIVSTLLSGCLDNKLLISFKDQLPKSKNILSLFKSEVEIDKNFGVSGEFNLSAFSRHLQEHTDLEIRNVHSDNQNGFYIELADTENSNKIIKLNSLGNIDTSFDTIRLEDGPIKPLIYHNSPYFKILKVLDNGSFFVGGSGIKESCINESTLLNFPFSCLVLKKYLPNGKLDLTFSNNGVLDLPVSLDSNNKLEHLMILSNSDILISGNFTISNSGIGSRPFHTLLSSDGTILLGNQQPAVQGVLVVEKIVEVKKLPSSQFQVISISTAGAFPRHIFKRILNSNLSADNSFNASTGFKKTALQAPYNLNHFVVNDDIIFLQDTLNSSSPLSTISAGSTSRIEKYNITNETLTSQLITNPLLGNTTRVIVTGGVVKEADNDFFIFAHIGNSSGAISRMITKYNLSNLTVDTSYENSGSKVFAETVNYYNNKDAQFMSANNQNIFEFRNKEQFCTSPIQCYQSFVTKIYSSEGAEATTQEIPLNGKIADFKISRTIKLLGNTPDYLLLKNGDLITTFSHGNSLSKYNSNYFLKISSNGNIQNSFGINGLAKFNNALISRMIDNKDGSFFVVYFSHVTDFLYNLYVSKINSQGEFDNNFGVNGHFLIGSNILVYSSFYTNEQRKLASTKVEAELKDSFLNISFLDQNDIFNNIRIDLKANAIKPTNNINLSNLNNLLASISPPNANISYSMEGFKVLVDSGEVILAILSMTDPNKDLEMSLWKLDSSGNFVSDFGDNGIMKILSRNQMPSNYSAMQAISLQIIDNKIQTILSYLEREANGEYFAGTHFIVIDPLVNKIVLDEKIGENNYNVYMVNSYQSLTLHSAIFTGLKAKTFNDSTQTDADLSAIISYLSIANNVVTYEEIDWGNLILNQGASISAVNPVDDNLYILLNQTTADGSPLLKYIKLKKQ